MLEFFDLAKATEYVNSIIKQEHTVVLEHKINATFLLDDWKELKV